MIRQQSVLRLDSVIQSPFLHVRPLFGSDPDLKHRRKGLTFATFPSVERSPKSCPSTFCSLQSKLSAEAACYATLFLTILTYTLLQPIRARSIAVANVDVVKRMECTTPYQHPNASSDRPPRGNRMPDSEAQVPERHDKLLTIRSLFHPGINQSVETRSTTVSSPPSQSATELYHNPFLWVVAYPFAKATDYIVDSIEDHNTAQKAAMRLAKEQKRALRRARRDAPRSSQQILHETADLSCSQHDECSSKHPDRPEQLKDESWQLDEPRSPPQIMRRRRNSVKDL